MKIYDIITSYITFDHYLVIPTKFRYFAGFEGAVRTLYYTQFTNKGNTFFTHILTKLSYK